MDLQVNPGLTCSTFCSSSCPGAGSHCTAAADSQSEHINHWQKHRFISTLSLSRSFSRMLAILKPRLNLGCHLGTNNFPWHADCFHQGWDVAGSGPKASILSCHAPQVSAGASSPRETPSVAAVTMALRDRPLANTQRLPIKAAVGTGTSRRLAQQYVPGTTASWQPLHHATAHPSKGFCQYSPLLIRP